MTAPEPTPVTRAAAEICARIGHEFADPALLRAALTHPSWRNEHLEAGADNQRLEFLGDAVIDLIVARHLFDALADCREGMLTVLKSTVVSEPALAALAREIGLGGALHLGKGEQRHGGDDLPSVLSDALEALFGALLIDAGYRRTREIALDLFAAPLAQAIRRGRAHGDEPEEVHIGVANWKTAVQEQLQALGEQPPVYRVIAEDGPAHERLFSVRAEARLAAETLTAEGEGRTKKAAENVAAERLHGSVLAQVDGRQVKAELA